MKSFFCYKAIITVLLFFVMFTSSVEMYGQQSSYRVCSVRSEDNASVTITVVVYCKDKKAVAQEAQLSALYVVMFEGCPNTPFSKAFLEDGATTSYQQSPYYFDNLYAKRYGDFISDVKYLSAFKKADKQKGTAFEIIVKATQLRKDLEKNNIKRRFGL